MTRDDFDKGMVILGACGVPLGEMPMDIWFRVLAGLESKLFESACYRLVAITPNFYQQPNIPGLIIEQSKLYLKGLGEARIREESRKMLSQKFPEYTQKEKDQIRQDIKRIPGISCIAQYVPK